MTTTAVAVGSDSGGSAGTLVAGRSRARARPQNASAEPLDAHAFRHFPYGLLVTAKDGSVISHNLQAMRLIEARGLTSKGLTCCELLGCRAPDSVLAGFCVSETALAHGALLPEMRVDLETSSGPQSMWIAAAPLHEGPGSVVLQLRPGVPRDRRRRTDPHWMRGPTLRIRALGKMVVESAEGPIGGNWLDQRTGQLLKYLVAERHRCVHVEEIGENVWPEADFAIASSVRYYIHSLRGKLEPAREKRAPSAFIIARGGGYRLDLERVKIDADEFEAHVTAGIALMRSDPERAEEELDDALALYRGDFLADMPYAEWALSERHRLHDLACKALRALVDLRLQRRMLGGAVRALERLATMQPYDEAVHRELMELDIMRGHRSTAIRRYNALRSRMRRAFGHDPGFTPADLQAHKR